VAALYLAVLVHPQPLFAYSATVENLTLYARAPLPEVAPAVLDDALRRIQRSPLYSPAVHHRVFLCNSSSLFFFLSGGTRRGRAVTVDFLNGNIFIASANVERGEVYGRSGAAAGPDRPLSYFIAHEVAHHMTSTTLGRWRYFRMPVWLREGYADYVARLGPANLTDATHGIQSDEPDWDPTRSGLYLRYWAEVTFLLDDRHTPIDQALRSTRTEAEVLADLLARPSP
jgi:hypothetical protein